MTDVEGKGHRIRKKLELSWFQNLRQLNASIQKQAEVHQFDIPCQTGLRKLETHQGTMHFQQGVHDNFGVEALKT